MITTVRPGVNEYAASFADYVTRIADDEDIVAVVGYRAWRHHPAV